MSFAVRTLRTVAAKAVARPTATRAFTAFAPRLSDHQEPQIFGTGGKTGEVPTDLDQATGLERFELMYKLKGEEAFSTAPLEVVRMGTLDAPIEVFSLDNTRIVGCTGFPVDSHDTFLFTINKEKPTRCPECGCATKQRLVDTALIPPNIHPKYVRAEKDSLVVGWPAMGKDPAYESRYPFSFLERHAYDPPLDKQDPETTKYLLLREGEQDHAAEFRFLRSKILWTKDIGKNPPKVTHDEVMSSEKGVYEWLKRIDIYGFCLVEGIPGTPEATEALVRRIAFIRETHYGAFWDFTADLQHGDLAYSDLPLNAHTDTTYFSDPCGLQLFHLLSPDSSHEGGHNLLVDGFRAAALFEAQDPEFYSLFSTIKVPAHASGTGSASTPSGVHTAPLVAHPVFTHDGKGDLVQIRWNGDDRGVVGGEAMEGKMEMWYEALRAWETILRDEEAALWSKMHTGTASLTTSEFFMVGPRSLVSDGCVERMSPVTTTGVDYGVLRSSSGSRSLNVTTKFLTLRCVVRLDLRMVPPSEESAQRDVRGGSKSSLSLDMRDLQAAGDTTDGYPIQFEPFPSKNYIEAKFYLYPGQRILDESPLFTADNPTSPLTVRLAVVNLPENFQRVFLALPSPLDLDHSNSSSSASSSKSPMTESPVSGGEFPFADVRANISRRVEETILPIFAANTFPLGGNTYPSAPVSKSSPGVGIFPILSRVAHSCTPNSNFHWEATLGRMILNAIRPIAATERLSITLVDPFLPSIDRKAFLRQRFGYECECAACRQDSEGTRMSDARRTRVRIIFQEMPYQTKPQTVLRRVEEAINLLNEEGLLGYKGCFFYDAAQFCIACSDFGAAKGWLQRAYEAFVIERGEESEDAKLMGRYLANPAEHHARGRLPQHKLKPTQLEILARP
ncbi:cytochrome c oxidase subunit 5b, partial [Phenoliferia sp. Uapishka_3]